MATTTMSFTFGAEIVGRASVIDGHTIEIYGERIRLCGIDAPESDQLCRNQDSDLYQCGRLAATALAGLLYAIPRPVTCSPTGHDQHGRTVAICFLGTPARTSRNGWSPMAMLSIGRNTQNANTKTLDAASPVAAGVELTEAVQSAGLSYSGAGQLQVR
jgi:hypothetical protein